MRKIDTKYLARCVRLYELALAYRDIYDPEDEYCRFHDLFADLDAGATAAELRAHHDNLKSESEAEGGGPIPSEPLT